MVSFLTTEDNFYGVKLRIILDCKNISVPALSYKTRFSASSLYNYLNGHMLPDEKTQKKIIQVLDINPCYFFDDTVEKFLEKQKQIKGNYKTKIKQIYKKLHMTISEIEAKLELESRSFEFVICKRSTPSIILLKKFVDIFHVNPAFYYYDDASMFLNQKSVEEKIEALARLLTLKTKN